MKHIVLVALAAVWLVAALAAQAPAPAADAPQFTAAGQLVRPLDYRGWVFLTSGLGMTYGPAAPAAGRPPMFDNVFVTRAAYREFLRSGTWPDKTMFVLEIRRSEEHASINNGGRTQGAIAAMEAAVKDVTRFPDGGWGYYSFD
ncbi:MAG: cytochrome P460, partial [Acidimicrobiia bacterium]|nr:cytochrome P460 [Acidimicrobiia bacterium]